MSPLPAGALIASLEDQNPKALQLAESVSFAVRAEPFLLRRMRLEFLAGADSSAEADLWLSPLVQLRSPEGIVFYPEVADALRRRFREARPERFEEAWRLVRQFHEHLPAAIRIEEEIAYFSADPAPGALREIERRLERAAKTLVASGGREGLTNWAARALPRLPERVRNLESARMLAWASYVRLTRHLPVGDLRAGQPLPEWLAWILPGNVEHTQVRVRLVSGGVELSFGGTAGSTVPVPDTEPCPIEISWSEDGRDEVRQVLLRRGESRLIPAPARDFRIRTLLGDRYRLTEKRQTMADQPNAPPGPSRLCYVVMGFGKKTDYPTGRVLDLDKSYEYIIKPAGEAAGMRVLRADEISHAGTITAPMFEYLLSADVVVADLSTYNPDAFYELGVRHALRPYQTIVIAEDKMSLTFDMAGLRVFQYRHLGDGIDFAQVQQMREALISALRVAADNLTVDSPVYTALQGLTPPERIAPTGAAAPSPPEGGRPALKTLLDQADGSIADSRFDEARALLNSARALAPTEPAVLQKLALAIYKSRRPNAVAALQEARSVLSELKPESTTDTETLGLWGAIHKRLWDETSDRAALDVSIDAYEKGFLLKNDYYNGINYAFLLNLRAGQAPAPEAVADFVLAQRVRRKVIDICQALLASGKPPRDEQYWIRATLAEAYLGIGDRARSDQAMKDAQSAAPQGWMVESTAGQLKRLEQFLAESPLRRYGLSDSPGYRT